MPFTTSSTVISSHKHSSATGDGGDLDADQTEVDGLLLVNWDMRQVNIWS